MGRLSESWGREENIHHKEADHDRRDGQYTADDDNDGFEYGGHHGKHIGGDGVSIPGTMATGMESVDQHWESTVPDALGLDDGSELGAGFMVPRREPDGCFKHLELYAPDATENL